MANGSAAPKASGGLAGEPDRTAGRFLSLLRDLQCQCCLLPGKRLVQKVARDQKASAKLGEFLLEGWLSQPCAKQQNQPSQRTECILHLFTKYCQVFHASLENCHSTRSVVALRDVHGQSQGKLATGVVTHPDGTF